MSMKLYKYVSADIAKLILKNRTIRYTQPDFLNDPYEGVRFNKSDLPIELSDNLKLNIESGDLLAKNIAEATIQGLQYKKKKIAKEINVIRLKVDSIFGVLSLSRTPYSLLMWAHYADNHKGCLIEFDSDFLPALGSSQDVIVDVDSGAVTYSSVPLDAGIIAKLLIDEQGSELVIEQKTVLPHLLYKSLEWAYEEEIRLVNNITLKGYSSKITNDVENIYLYNIPNKAITSVTLGMRCNDDEICELTKAIGAKVRNASLEDSKFAIAIRDV